MSTTGPSIVELSTVHLEAAYMAMAMGETLTDEQNAAIKFKAPDNEEIDDNVSRCKAIAHHQQRAGTLADRQKARDDLAALDSDLPEQVAELKRVIRQKQKEIDLLEKRRDDQAMKIKSMEGAVNKLRERCAPEYIKHENMMLLRETRPDRVRLRELRREIGDLDRVFKLKPNQRVGFEELFLNEVVKSFGITKRLIKDHGRESDNGSWLWDHQVDADALAEAKEAIEPRRAAMQSEIDDTADRIQRDTAEAEKLLDFYVPQ